MTVQLCYRPTVHRRPAVISDWQFRTLLAITEVEINSNSFIIHVGSLDLRPRCDCYIQWHSCNLQRRGGAISLKFWTVEKSFRRNILVRKWRIREL